MKRLKIFLVLLCSVAIFSYAPLAMAENNPAPTPAAEAAAASVVKKFYSQLTDVMKQGDQLGFSGRFKKLKPVVTGAYDLPLMTRLSVGLVWSKATADEQQQLISAFSDFSVANYASQFVRYDGEQFTITDEKATNDGVIVETKLQTKTGKNIALNYLMHQDDKGNWRIVDVLLDGSISELATRRSEFSSIANHDGIPALVNSLGEKSKQMGPS